MNKYPKLIPATLIFLYALLFVCGNAIHGRYCLHTNAGECAYPQTSSSPDSDHDHCQHDVGVDNIERKAGDSEDLPYLITSDCSTCLTLGQTSYPASCVSLSVSTEPPFLIRSIVFELPQQSLASFFLARGPPSFFLQSS